MQKKHLILIAFLIAVPAITYYTYFRDTPNQAPLSVAERVINLPEDGHKWYTTIIYQDKKINNNLSQILHSNPRLINLLNQTNVNEWDANTQMYKVRYQKYLGDRLPALMIQRDDGKVCFKVSGDNVPTDGNVLADAIAASFSDCRPKPPVVPQPTPVQPVVIPDVTPAKPHGFNFLALLPFVGAALGLYQEWKKSINV